MSSVRRTHRRRSPALLIVAALGLVLSLFSVGASADPPATATQIVVTSVSTPSIDVPVAPGSPASFIVQDIDFTVHAAFVGADGVTPLPLSSNKDVTLDLAVLSGPDAASGIATVEVPKGHTSASFTGVQLATPDNQVQLRVDAVGRKTDEIAPGDSAVFEVLKSFQAAPSTSTLTSIGFVGAAGTGCEATPDEPVCADLVLPNSAGVLSSQLLSLGACDASVGCPEDRSVVQALVDLDPNVYTRESPATLIMKCDKTSCEGGGISSYTLDVSLKFGDPMETAQACTEKGVVDPGLEYCVDYRQSTRDNAGDTHLFLLFLQDRRVAFP